MAKAIDQKTIEKMARLSHLQLDDVVGVSEDLSAILSWIGQLEEVDVSGVEPLAHAMELAPVQRADVADPPLDVETALGSAPESQSGFFTTPKTNE